MLKCLHFLSSSPYIALPIGGWQWRVKPLSLKSFVLESNHSCQRVWSLYFRASTWPTSGKVHHCSCVLKEIASNISMQMYSCLMLNWNPCHKWIGICLKWNRYFMISHSLFTMTSQLTILCEICIKWLLENVILLGS